MINGWRKPELIKPETFSQLNYTEAEQVEAAWREVAERAEKLSAVLPAGATRRILSAGAPPGESIRFGRGDELIVSGAQSAICQAGQGQHERALAARARELFRQDRAMTDYYNHELAGGKMESPRMDQTHLGQFSGVQSLCGCDAGSLGSFILKDKCQFRGIHRRRCQHRAPATSAMRSLPAFDSFQPRRSFIDIFRMGPNGRSILQSRSGNRGLLLTKDTSPQSLDSALLGGR